MNPREAMITAKVYKDIDGNDCTIHQIVRREPQWAATRIQVGEKAIKELQVLKKEYARLLVLATKHCPPEHHDWEEILKICGDA